MSHNKQDVLNYISAMKIHRVNAENSAISKGFSGITNTQNISTFADALGPGYPGSAGVLTGGTLFYMTNSDTVSIPVTIHAKNARFGASGNVTITAGPFSATETTLTANDASLSQTFSGAPSFGRIHFIVTNADDIEENTSHWVVKPGT